MSSCSTPQPLSYNQPRQNCDGAYPFSAAFRCHLATSAAPSCETSSFGHNSAPTDRQATTSTPANARMIPVFLLPAGAICCGDAPVSGSTGDKTVVQGKGMNSLPQAGHATGIPSSTGVEDSNTAPQCGQGYRRMVSFSFGGTSALGAGAGDGGAGVFGAACTCKPRAFASNSFPHSGQSTRIPSMGASVSSTTPQCGHWYCRVWRLLFPSPMLFLQRFVKDWHRTVRPVANPQTERRARSRQGC